MLVVGHRVRCAFLPVVGEGELLLAGAVGAHAPDVHLAVDLTAEEDPLAVGRHGDLGLVVLVVRQAPHVLPVEVGGVELGALRIGLVIAPVADRHVEVVARGGPDQVLPIREEIRAGVLSVIVDALYLRAEIGVGVHERARAAVGGGPRERVLRRGNDVQVVRRVVGLGRGRNVRDLPYREIGGSGRQRQQQQQGVHLHFVSPAYLSSSGVSCARPRRARWDHRAPSRFLPCSRRGLIFFACSRSAGPKMSVSPMTPM